MDESDAAHAVLLDLERTLHDVRGRLADLVLLAGGPVQADPPSPDLLAADVLPSADALCEQATAHDLPDELVLPSTVEAPPVVLPEDGHTTLDLERAPAMSAGADSPA